MASFRKSQAGVTLIELILVLGLISFLTVLDFQRKNIELEQAKAKTVGSTLSAFNNAVRAWLSANVGHPNANKIGTKWLKHTSCGGQSSIAYLPCDFPEAIPASPIDYGQLALRSAIKTTGSEPNQVTTITTQTTPFTLSNGDVRSDLSGIAAMVAASTAGNPGNLSSLTADSSYKSNPATAEISMLVSNNGFDDAWLRTDGSNHMNSNITFSPLKPEQLRQINNVSRLQSIPGINLFIGEKGGSSANSQVVVDANLDVLGDLRVRKNINVDGQIKSAGNITSDKTIKASEDVEAARNMVAQRYYDANNKAFYLDPSSNTIINSLSVESTMDVKGKSSFEETLILKKVVSQGSSCTDLASLARSSGGSILSCMDGIWRPIGQRLNMIAPRLVFSGSASRAWTSIYLGDAPSGSQHVQLQYEFEIAYPDDVPNSTIYARSSSSGSQYIVTAGRSAGSRDSNGGGGQAIVPYDQASKSFQLRVNRVFGGGWYRVYVIGYM